MENFMKPRVQIQDADKSKPYFKYYERELAPLAPEKMGCAFGGPMSPMEAVPFKDREKLLSDDGLGNRIGYTVMMDGTGYISDTTIMPGVTTDMIDWYMAWRGLDPLRYIILNPEQNMMAMSMQSHKFDDEDLVGPEKYWDTTQTVMRMGEQGPEKEFLNFKCPYDVGFSKEAIETSKTERVICIRGYAEGLPPTAGPDYLMVHQILPIDGGVEVRTKCWLGWTTRYGKDYKQLPDDFRMPPVFAMGAFLKTAAEMANLAAILPDLYKENK